MRAIYRGLVVVLWMICFSIVYASPNKKVLGYVMSSARYRPDPWNFQMADLNSSMLTHAAYAFVNPAADGFISDSESIEYKKFVFFAKRLNPDVVPMVAIGGWNFNSQAETRSIFSNIMVNSGKRSNLIFSVVSFCRLYGFEGMDWDWEFPAYQSQGGTSADKQNFATFLQELRSYIDSEASSSGKNALFVSVAVSGNT
jgi:chitinase